MARYEDAVRLEGLVMTVLGNGEADSGDEAEYNELIQRLVTENDEEVASQAGALRLPKSLKLLAAETRSRRDNLLTTTGFADGMRRIKEILRARLDRHLPPDDHSIAEPPIPRRSVRSSTWTGASTPAGRVKAVRTLIPVAREAVEQLISSLQLGQHNGGPPLHDHQDALAALKSLHSALGKLLQAADDGRLDRQYHGGLVDEAVRYSKRMMDSLRHDPLPYATAATVLAIMCACGFPTAGAFLADVTFNIRRSPHR